MKKESAVFIPMDLARSHGPSRFNYGFEDVLGESWRRLGFESLPLHGRKPHAQDELLKRLVLPRLFCPLSKLGSCRLPAKRFNQSASRKQALTMMDRLAQNEEEIRQKVFRSMLEKSSDLSLLLFDVTTLCFESVPVMQNVPPARGLMADASPYEYIPSELIEPAAEVLRIVRDLEKQ